MMGKLLVKNMKLEREFKDINLDGVGEFAEEMMSDLYWDLFSLGHPREEEYIVESANDYATTLLENKEQLIEALNKTEVEFIEDMNKRDMEINEYAIKDNSLEYLSSCLDLFEDLTT